ncbi:two-component system regulatory protein YycI [Paenibacillus sp. TRM 82003]|nr:two-component system regulatory protein YycI [Paenibacillus sp. TRM 82003]
MDWSRAKTVLILSFLMLNVLLGYQLWMDELNLNTFTENAAKREEMNRLLALKNVRLDAPVPEGMPALSEITVSLSNAGRLEAPVPLNRPFATTVLGDPALVRESLQAEFPNVEAYQHDPYAVPIDAETPDFVMNQLHGDLPMFVIRLELFAEGETVTAHRAVFAEVEPSGSLATKAQEVLSAYIVLGSLAENYLPQGAVVKDIRLGYHGPMFESETQVLAPYWRVVTATGETYYVHAVNGAVEGPSPAKVRQNDPVS